MLLSSENPLLFAMWDAYLGRESLTAPTPTIYPSARTIATLFALGSCLAAAVKDCQGLENNSSGTLLDSFKERTEYKDANGPYQHERKAVEVALVDGSTRELKDILRAVLDMWRSSRRWAFCPSFSLRRHRSTWAVRLAKCQAEPAR